MLKTVLTLTILSASILRSQTLLRKASVGIAGTPVSEGIRVDSVYPGSSAVQLKLKKQDIITSLNNFPATTMESYNAIATQLKVGDKLEVKFLREGKALSASCKALVRPLETSNLADITYDWVKFRNGHLRTMTRKPKGKTNVPCILLIPGYGCGSIENFRNGYNGRLINEWLKQGYAVVTIEKSGVGDSHNCEPCTEVDLKTDIESFDAGYNYMEKLDFVDKSRLFIWGHSMGGVIAPEIAKLHQPRGVMVFGTVFRPWSEFLLEMHRVQKPLLDNLSYTQTEEFIRLMQKVYYEFFVLKKSRTELYNIPEYRNIVATELEYKEGSSNMWGRHWKFWQQLDSLNLSQSWSSTNCPVLIIQGGTDYEQCAPIEPVLIEKTVNASHPGNATRVQVDDLDHFMMKSDTYREAVENFRNQAYTKGNFNHRIADETILWLNKQNKGG